MRRRTTTMMTTRRRRMTTTIDFFDLLTIFFGFVEICSWIF